MQDDDCFISNRLSNNSKKQKMKFVYPGKPRRLLKLCHAFGYNLPPFPLKRIKHSNLLQSVARTAEHRSNGSSLEVVDDALHASVGTNAKEEDTNGDDEDVQSSHQVSIHGPLLEEGNGAICSSHSEVGDTPEDEAKEAVEEGRHQGQDWTALDAI